MHIALIADIHANLPALSAVLNDIKRKHAPDMIISLGDQVNLGPCPKETLALLSEHHVACLHGNHERYILAAMKNDPGYAGANFESLRFNATKLTPEEITFPQTLQMEGVTFCHALPGVDRFPVFDVDAAIPELRGMQSNQPMHIICGHGHNPTHLRIGNITVDSIGSVGCMDDGVPGVSPYAMLILGKDYTGICPCFAAYDPRAHRSLFIESGMKDFCPIMSHIICLQMESNQDFLLPFVALAHRLAKEKNETRISMETWRQADGLFDWPDGKKTSAFWA